MDSGIHMPALLVDPRGQHPTNDHNQFPTHSDLLDQTDDVLNHFRRTIPEHYTTCSALYETAKQLHHEMHEKLYHGKLSVLQGQLNLNDFEQSVEYLVHHQEKAWDKLHRGQEIERDHIQQLYAPVMEYEKEIQHVVKEGIPKLPKTILIRRAYHYRLKRNFHEARNEVDELCAYPYGMLSQIALLKQKTERDVSVTMERLRKRQQSQHFLNPMRVFKAVGSH